MRRSIRCLLLGALAVAALRHLSTWSVLATSPWADGLSWYGALSFALAAVVDTDREA